MSGHSKWSKIKRQKGAADGAKSRMFSRFSRLITMESKRSAGNVSSPALATAIARAKSANMPNDTIDRAVLKGISKDAGELERVVYETYGPGGCAVLICALTDNRNRTAQEVKHALTKLGYELAAPGSAAWAFAKEPDGSFVPNDPIVALSEEDEMSLAVLLESLDLLEDVDDAITNADGFASLQDE